MQRSENDREFEDLIRAGSREAVIPDIQVTDTVMARINTPQPFRFTNRQRLTRRGSIIFAGLLTLLFVSVSAYAASEWIQIRNADGVVKVQYKPPIPPAQYTYSVDKYQQFALGKAKPEQLIAYLDDSKNAEVEMNFAYKEKRLESYDAFRAELKRTGAPIFPDSAAGYAFEHGSSWPDYPKLDSKLYNDTLTELLARKSHSAPGTLIFKSIPWTKGSSASATYTNSKLNAHIGLNVQLLLGGKFIVSQEAANNPETITVAGRTIILNDVVRPEVSYQYINWYNEEQDAVYTLTTYGDHILDKAHLIELAGQLIKGGL